VEATEEKMPMLLDRFEVVTLFVDDIDAAKTFYQKVFALDVVCEDAVSSVLKFSGTMINLLDAAQALNWSSPPPCQSPVRARASC
jgi:catechol 2,3-dioxygenase-like lactoylglutathione lyase family enzyme